MSILPDGEYEIEFSQKLSRNFENPPSIPISSETNSISKINNLFQLRFSKYPIEINENPKFELYPKKPIESNTPISNNHYILSTNDTSIDKSLISDVTGLKTKEIEYVLILNDDKLQLSHLNSVLRVNKPKKATKKSIQELDELRDFYINKNVDKKIATTTATTTTTTTTTTSNNINNNNRNNKNIKNNKNNINKNNMNFNNNNSENKWEKIETKPKKVSKKTSTEDDEEFNFDNFDQFNDELSTASRMSIGGKKLPTSKSKENEDIDMESFEDELEDELKEVFGNDDELIDFDIEEGDNDKIKKDDDDEVKFSDIELEEDDDDELLEPRNDKVENETKDKAPISLKDLMGQEEDEEDFSEEE